MVFYKYHGCGNDFVLIDEIKNADYRSLAVRMCERRRGIGADGLIVCSPRPPSMRIFNSDGSEDVRKRYPLCRKILCGHKNRFVGEDVNPHA